MIKTFRDAETEKVPRRQFSRKLPAAIQQTALRKLRMLNNAVTLEDLRVPPANHLEKLSGDRAGQYSQQLAPIHPGEVLLEEFLKPMGISQNHLAMQIGVPARRI